ncbi:MAG TPA: response regulator [Armatimonadota bacterium]|nr:response regulator [Armatimonadota bacterium]
MRVRILVVDDEARLVRMMESALQDAGYRVSSACDGVDALAQIHAERPDLVVLDAMMPRMDGFEALRHLKSDPETADLPMLMLTARAADASVFTGWQMGVNCYLCKPFHPAELLAFVQRVLHPPTAENKEQGITL